MSQCHFLYIFYQGMIFFVGYKKKEIEIMQKCENWFKKNKNKTFRQQYL